MRAVLLFVVVAAICVTGAWWIAALPGSVSISIAGLTFEAGTPVALTLIAALFVVLYIVFRLIGGLFRLPRRIARWKRDGNRVRGDEAVTRTLTALAGNDVGAARREAGRSRRLLGDTPLTLLLSAQAGRQSGRDAEAQAYFQQLADRPDGRLLGLRGLLREAVAREDWPAAALIAKQAEEAHPGTAWLTDERRRIALKTGEWNEALRLNGPAKGKNADLGARAALSVAAANEAEDASAGLRLAKQAWDAEPSLAPAAVAYASRLRTAGKERSALDVLRRAWSLAPQPDVAAAYLAPAADPMGRLRAAQDLAGANPQHPDSALLLARTALDAGLVAEARRHADTARKAGLESRRLWVLLADIAETEGDADGAQEALRQIPVARPDPAWRCMNCGTVHEAWHPVCDACSTAGRITWIEAEVPQVLAPRLRPPAAIEGFS